MKVISKVEKMQEMIEILITNKNTIGFIPTMGALHEGHLSLIQQARKENDRVIVSIFVNPKQFNNPQDLKRYPRTLERDKELIAEYVDYVFVPEVEDLYPSRFQTTVRVSELANDLEGTFRPGHFEGMATVVLKLLHISQPTRAYFGLKDYQQYLIVKQMARDLAMSTEIIGVPTVREDSGLALSSRNSRLSPLQKEKARVLYRSLQQGKQLIETGEQQPAAVIKAVKSVIENDTDFILEYVALRDAVTFKPVAQIEGDVVILIAASIGEVRLIDNVVVIIKDHGTHR